MGRAGRLSRTCGDGLLLPTPMQSCRLVWRHWEETATTIRHFPSIPYGRKLEAIAKVEQTITQSDFLAAPYDG